MTSTTSPDWFLAEDFAPPRISQIMHGEGKAASGSGFHHLDRLQALQAWLGHRRIILYQQVGVGLTGAH